MGKEITIGRIVRYAVAGRVLPAIVTRVWGDAVEGPTIVNLYVFPDTSAPGVFSSVVTSVAKSAPQQGGWWWPSDEAVEKAAVQA